MNWFNYIKKSLPVYLASGVMLAATLSSLLVIQRYNIHFDNTIEGIKDLSLKKDLLKKESAGTEALIKHIKDDLDADMTQADPEKLMFRALDNMKAALKDASITVPALEGTGNSNELPLNIEAGMKNYKMILDYVAYLESLEIPGFEIRSIDISKDTSGGVLLRISGALVMPSVNADAPTESIGG